MFVNKMIRSGLVIQSRTKFGSGSYPSDYNPYGRFATESETRPSNLPNQFDTGFQTTKSISPFQQSIQITRVKPNSLYKPSKGDLRMKALKGSTKRRGQFKQPLQQNIEAINKPVMGELFYDDVFGKRANELVDYVGDQLNKRYFKNFNGVGIKGDIGPAGPQGAIGPRGEMGMTGAPGERGEMGMTGAPGERGEMGMTGAPGERGPQGIQGERGERGEQGLVGNTPSVQQLQSLIQQQLADLPDYLQNLIGNQLQGLPTYVKGEVVSQLQDLPRLIETNSIGLNDVKPIIAQMIEEARPQPADIHTNLGAIVNIPQDTEMGNVVVSKPERLIEYPSSTPLNSTPAAVPIETMDNLTELKRMRRQLVQKLNKTEIDFRMIEKLEDRIQEIVLEQKLENAFSETTGTSAARPPVPPPLKKRTLTTPSVSKRPKIKREPISQEEQARITLERQIAELETKIRVLSKRKQTNKIKNQIFQLESALMRLKQK